MVTKLSLVAAAVAGAIIATILQFGLHAVAADPPMPVPPLPAEADTVPSPQAWEPLEFKQAIPSEWGTMFSINRVEKSGESYTFWFLGTDGTLRGVTTREFTGPNRASFFPEVYVIRRK